MCVQCFGLLGVNGAGKTSTFRMLSGDVHITSGEASIGAASMSAFTHQDGKHAKVGYCPQVDALMDNLTGRQHLIFYCRLRGLSAEHVKKVVEWTVEKLMLKEYADKPAGTYSGGNRRKLSTAIALLARPSLILLVSIANILPFPCWSIHCSRSHVEVCHTLFEVHEC